MELLKQLRWADSREQGGFRLIELIIVVETVAILAAIVIPAYQNHAVSAWVMEATGLAALAKSNRADRVTSGVWSPAG